MRLLVTRPEEDSVAFKAHLVAAGHDVTIEPLLKISTDNTDPIELEGVQALIATSRNGLRALADTPHLDVAKTLPLFAVGPGTASTARAMGFTAIITGPSNAAELVPFIVANADINCGGLLHLAGDTVAPQFADELGRLGFYVTQPVVYTTEVATRFASPTVASMRNKRIDGVILLSPRTSEVYCDLVRQHKLEAACRDIVHFCLSSAVVLRLQALGSVPVEQAAVPNLQEMLALIERYTAKSAT